MVVNANMSMIINIPRRLPLLIVGHQVLLPGASIRIPIAGSHNMVMVREHLLKNTNTLTSTIVGIVSTGRRQDDINAFEVLDDALDLHPIGTAAVVVQITGTNWPRPSYTLLITGLCRFRLVKLVQRTPFRVGFVEQLDRMPIQGDDAAEASAELSSLVQDCREKAVRLLDMLDVTLPVAAKLKRLLNSVPSHNLADICASIVKASYDEKLEILDAVDLTKRFNKTLPLLKRQLESLQLVRGSRAGSIVGDMQDGNMENPIRLTKHVKRLPQGIDSQDGDDIVELEKNLEFAKMPESVHKVAMKELQRLKKMVPQMPEYSLTRLYLELMSELPWSNSSNQTLDILKARKDLDGDHYAMENVKKRVIEYLAVRQLKNSLKGPILCFVGPPGVGKTSIGRSIANTLGREFHRIALGGVCDHSDIRGHRRTYIGSMPGRIVQGLRTAGTNNPVFLLDEIDKLSAGIHGDPSAALLEVLDPEQNCNFTDHYLNVPFDLSQVLFIATANSVSTIPAALLDRMEVIRVSGYTHDEKLQIAIQHLLPKQLNEHGLSREVLQIPEDSMKTLILNYTREAGVRNLERKIGALCRAVAVKVAERRPRTEITLSRVDPFVHSDMATPPELPIVLDDNAIEDILGPRVYENEMSSRLGQPGVAVGLAWTAVGGEIMFVEATCMDGDGHLFLTGQLGDVMKESAKLALNWVRTHYASYGIKLDKGTDLLDGRDVHVHFPAGAVGKDGPSAGVTIVSVLISLFTKRCVASDVAMTGEMTLRGLVLPVGGIKEKVLAAHRAGIRRVILPVRNQRDLQDIPDAVQKDLSFVFAMHVDDVLQAAFDGGFPGSRNHLEQIVPSSL